jgi:hypothetical protein
MLPEHDTERRYGGSVQTRLPSGRWLDSSAAVAGKTYTQLSKTPGYWRAHFRLAHAAQDKARKPKRVEQPGDPTKMVTQRSATQWKRRQNEPRNVQHPADPTKMVTKTTAADWTRKNPPEVIAARAAKAAAKAAAGGPTRRKHAYFGGKNLIKKAMLQNKTLVFGLGPQVTIKKEKQ